MIRSALLALLAVVLSSTGALAQRADGGDRMIRMERWTRLAPGVEKAPLLRLMMIAPPRHLYEGDLVLLGGERAYGVLRRGQRAEGRLVLPPGSYIVDAACGDACTSLRLAIEGDGGFAVDVPEEPASEGAVRLEVPVAAEYRFRITVRRCSNRAGCQFGLTVFKLG